MSVGKYLLTVLLAPLLVGCSGGVVRQLYAEYNVTSGPSLFSYVGWDRDFRTEIYGNPTGASKDAFDAAVLAATQGGIYGAFTNFTTRPSDNARDDYRLVLAFSGEPLALSKGAVCGYIDPATLPAAEPNVYLHAAFCYKERPLMRTAMSIGPLETPTDSRLSLAVLQSVRTLFRHDPTVAGEGFDSR